MAGQNSETGKSMSPSSNKPTIFRRGIRRSLVLSGLALFGIALALNTFLGEIYTRRQIQHSTGAMQKEVASLTARHVQAYIAQKTLRLRDAATNLSLHPLGSQEQRITISLLVKNDESFEEISVLDDQGREHLRVSDLKVYFDSDLRELSSNPAFQSAVKSKDYVSPVYTSDKAEPYLFLAVPITNPTKSSIEVLLAKTSMRFISELVQKETFGRAGVIYIVNENGRLIASRDPLRVLQSPDLKGVPAVAEFLRARKKTEGSANRGQGLSGSDVLSTYAVVPGLRWGVVVEEPVEFALEDIRALEKFTRALLAAGLIVGFVLIVVLSKRVTSPILKLREGALAFGTGDLDHRVAVESKDEIGELATTFNEMADTIKTAQDELETRVQRRTQELSLLYGVTTQLNQTLELSNVLNYTLAHIRDYFHFDAIRFYLFDERFETLNLVHAHSSSTLVEDSPVVFRPGEGLVGKVAESGEAIVFEDTHSDPPYGAMTRSNSARTAGLHFVAVMPVKTKSQTFGVAVLSKRAPQSLGDDGARLLNAICEQIAIAVEKSRLFQEVNKRSEDLEIANRDLRSEIEERERAQNEVSRQHARIKLLHDITSAISRTLDRRILLDTLSTRLEDLAPYSATILRLVNRTTGRLESVTAGWLDSEADTSVPSNGLSRLVVDQKQTLVVEDLYNDPRVSRPDYWRSHGLVSYVGIPLISESQLLGVLSFYLNQKHDFAKEELEFLSTLAGQVAIALYNSELYERTRQQAIDLEEANKAKDEFLNVMSHELRTPLNVVSGYAQVLDEGVLGDISDEQRHAVQTIIFQSKELLRMINEILQVGSLQAGKVRIDFEDTNLNQLFKELVSACGVLSKKAIELRWDVPAHLPVVRSDGDKIKHILQNLIHNALKFTEEGSVTVSAACTDSGVQFKVKDTGVGIGAEKLPLIFEMFRQVDSSKTRSYGGAGVGLFIVKRFVELLNGTIQVESKVGVGTTFTVTIPAYVAGTSKTESTGGTLMPNDLAL